MVQLVRLAALALPLRLLASNAHAYAIDYVVSPTTGLTTSDTVQVDIYIDADQGLQLLSIGVLWRQTR